MPSSGVHLNNELFFKYFICDAFSKASKELLNAKDRLKVRVAAIAIGIFTLGIVTAICRCYYYDKKTIAPANLLKMQKAYLTKKFSGSDENKIKVINSLNDGYKEKFHILRSIDSEERFGDFCIRKKHQIRSSLLPYICAFEVLEHLLNSSVANRHEEIRRLETHLLRRRHLKVYYECLLDTLHHVAFKKQLAEKILYGREDFLEMVYNRGLDFSNFKALYSEVKLIAAHTKIPNLFLQKEANINRRWKILAFACEFLESEMVSMEMLGTLSYNEQEYLRKCLTGSVSSQKIDKMITLSTPKKTSIKPSHKVEENKVKIPMDGSFIGVLRDKLSNWYYA